MGIKLFPLNFIYSKINLNVIEKLRTFFFFFRNPGWISNKMIRCGNHQRDIYLFKYFL